jgi:hypothetical protein
VNGSMKWFALMVLGVVAEVLIFATFLVAITGNVDGLAVLGDMVAKIIAGLIPR